MKNTFGTRHCYAKKFDGQMHYYAVYGKDVVEINKAIFDVLDRSYSKERYLARISRANQGVSLDQLYYEIEDIDTHNSVIRDLWVSSAEEEYMETVTEETKNHLLSLMWDEIKKLPEDDAQLLLSFNDNSVVKELAKREKLSRNALYYRRQQIAKEVATRIRRRLGHD